ncbi:hypothetical protein HWQ46_07460 [Shewanella sp. D64]|uniref:hypothetical protein n=1 Tax=unclassified Shewanella TaxID=196818 RepID=UPI0022BA4D98|nr:MULTISPECIES: hypothetical protein [unclassified Shewanella]MEC4725381.1 hypothetical protein [Shewanella sp. D64]MEC4735773.1 hypothetical protein [Shewanella sp. E94]WBJ93255.1 hypothetical protein HWQ47_14960 [Shewanella sp. MTB7]
MRKLTSLIALTFIPSLAWAHPGHDGIGLFHHMFDLLPIVAVIILVAGVYIWKRKQ